MRRHHLLAPLLAASLAVSPACAHKQLTNRQVAYGAIVVGLVVIVVIAASVSHCEENGCTDNLRF